MVPGSAAVTRGRRRRGPLQGYLGDSGAAVGKEAEFRGEPKGDVGERRRGLASRSPLCSFHSSSSFSIDRRLLTFDSFCSVCCSLACSLDSCLQGETERRERLQGPTSRNDPCDQKED